MNLILLATPVFFILIGLEVLISKLKKTNLYRFNDAITNINCGLVQQVSGIFFKAVLILGYVFLYEQARLFDVPENMVTWFLLFIGVDFFYYWFHRYSHEISLFWGTHIVHHQSEEYNLSVALRQSSFQTFISSFFYLPLAVIGFHPLTFGTIAALQTLYQFWIHTKTIDKLPRWFEYIFNTPSHHRVHHGRNPKYIDKNHGGTLIIFDRMFGTFQEEEEEVVYGVTKPLASWNPIWANFDFYNDLIRTVRQPMSWKDRIRVLLSKPGWRPEHLGGYQAPPPIKPEEQVKYDTSIPNGLSYYILVQYIILLFGSVYFLLSMAPLPGIYQAMGVGLILLAALNLGGLFEKKNWVLVLEYVRLLTFPMLIYLLITYLSIPLYLFVFVTALSVISAIWLNGYRMYFVTSTKQAYTGIKA